MIGERILLRLLALLSIRKNEVSRVLLFLLLQGLIGAVIGLLTGGIDARFIAMEPLPVEDALFRKLSVLLPRQNYGSSALAIVPFIQSAGALVLMALGTLYASLSDRRDKQKLFREVILAGAGVILVAFALCVVDQRMVRIPFLTASLYSLRFPAGVFLALLFWDAAGAFFDRRQGLRVFGTIMLGASIGYAVGSAAVGAIAVVLPVYYAFVPAALCAGAAALLLNRLRRLYVPVEPPVYKSGFSAGEVFDGLSDFAQSPVLRTIMFSTVVFGLLSGLIMFSWNRTVTAQFGDNAGEYMAFIRTGISILEVLILSRVISQPPLGRQMKYSWLVQGGFLLLGIIAFLVSMVGTADFTRQIGTTLLSPAALTLFSSVNSRKRGRSITINTMILAPAGMALAPLVLMVLKQGRIQNWLYLILLGLLILRILLTGQANRQYRISLARKAAAGSAGLETGLETAVDAALVSDETLRQFMERTAGESVRFREAVWQLLSEDAGPAAWKTLTEFKPDGEGPDYQWYLILALKFEGDAVLEECRRYTAALPLSRTEPLAAAKIAHFLAAGNPEGNRRLARLWKQFLLGKRISDNDRFALLRILARFYRPEWGKRIGTAWSHPRWREMMLRAGTGFPHPDFLPWYYHALEEPGLMALAAGYLARQPVLDYPLIGSLLAESVDPNLSAALMELLSVEGREGGRKRLLEHFNRLIDRFFEDRDGMGAEAGLPVYPGDNLLPEQLFICIDALLRYPVPLPPDLKKKADRLADAAEQAAAGLLSAWSRNRPADFPLEPLAGKMVQEDLNALIRLQFSAALLENFRPADFPVVRTVFEQLKREPGGIPSGVLETALVLLPGKRHKFASAFADAMTPAERLFRIRGWIRDTGFDFRALTKLWKRSSGLWHSGVRRRLVMNL